MKALDSHIRYKLIKKIAQAAERDPETSSEAEDLVNKKHNQLTQKVEEFLTDKSVSKFLEEKIVPHIQQPVEDFVEKNKDKAPQYVANPDLLMQDITNQVPILQYVKYLEYAMDAAFIASSVLSLVTVILSGGSAAAGAVPAEIGKWAARKSLKSFVKKFSKDILVKVFSKQALKTIAKKGLQATTQVGKYFLSEASRHASLLVVYDALMSVASDVTLIAVKNVVAEQGVKQFGIPRAVVDMLIQPDTDTGAFKRILGNLQNQVKTDLMKLFTTEKGFESLAFGVALRKVWSLLGIKSHAARLNMRATMHQMLKDPSYSKLDRLKRNIFNRNRRKSGEEKTSLINKEQLQKMLTSSHIPQQLHSFYYDYILDHVEGSRDQAAALEKAKAIIQSAEFTISTIDDSLLELAILEFIEENADFLKRNPRELESLLQDVVDSKTASIKGLMESTETSSLSDLVKNLKQSQITMVESLFDKISMGHRNEKLFSSLLNTFKSQIGFDSYKQNLAKEILRKAA